jgi:hypothetical protein
MVRREDGREEISCAMAAAEIDGRLGCGRSAVGWTMTGLGGAGMGRAGGRGGGAAGFCAFFGVMPRRIIS